MSVRRMIAAGILGLLVVPPALAVLAAVTLPFMLLTLGLELLGHEDEAERVYEHWPLILVLDRCL